MTLAWSALGVLVGAAGATISGGGPGWAAVLVHYAVPYVLLLAVAGRTAPGPGSAAVRAAACFVAFVAACSAVVALQYGSIPVRYAAAWAVAAVTVCPAAAAAVRWASRREGLLPASVFAAGGAVALADGTTGVLLRFALAGAALRARPVLLMPRTPDPRRGGVPLGAAAGLDPRCPAGGT